MNEQKWSTECAAKVKQAEELADILKGLNQSEQLAVLDLVKSAKVLIDNK